ncbi:MAG: chromosome segregation protein ScpA [Acidobacteria bacterium]|nr:chromosome segregation protein ScpA [Acidobacteriota bacterium]
MDDPYRIRLPAYEGPLDLLLELIRKQQIDIYDIPIAGITRQYLDTIQAMQELDIKLAGEFLLMAATLIHIKSRMLLPADPLGPESEQDDPRAELVHRLLEHEKFKNAAQMLHQKQVLERASWTLPGVRDFQETPVEPEQKASSFDLIICLHRIQERQRAARSLEIEQEEVTIGKVLRDLKNIFEDSRGDVPVERLFARYRSRKALVVVFVALLEMSYLQAIVLVQKQRFGEIVARRKDKFTEVMGDLEQWTGRIELAVVDKPS